eukprot:3722607-Rhodomonas_salina.2
MASLAPETYKACSLAGAKMTATGWLSWPRARIMSGGGEGGGGIREGGGGGGQRARVNASKNKKAKKKGKEESVTDASKLWKRRLGKRLRPGQRRGARR